VLKLLITLLVSVAALFTASRSYAERDGGNSGGGGVGFLCGDDIATQKVYLADTYRTLNPQNREQTYIQYPAAVIDAAVEAVERIKPEKVYRHPTLPNQNVSLGFLLGYKYYSLKFVEEITPIGSLSDDNIPTAQIPAGCRKVQLAIQDVPNGVVHLQGEHHRRLSEIEKGFLALHETLIAIRNQPGQDTTPIRVEVERIASALNDPRVSFASLVRNILNPGELPTSWRPRTSELDRFVDERCLGYGHPNGYLNEEHRQSCEQAWNQLREADRAQDQRNAVQTLLEFPRTLMCKVTYRNKTRPSYDSIKLEMPQGDARPHNLLSRSNLITISFIRNGQTIQTHTSTQTTFSTYRHRRAEGFRSFGDLGLHAPFISSPERSLRLYIGSYNPRTQQLVGGVFFRRNRNESDVGISCDVQNLRFGIDMTNSEQH
jgi:hypothetical protein